MSKDPYLQSFLLEEYSQGKAPLSCPDVLRDVVTGVFLKGACREGKALSAREHGVSPCILLISPFLLEGGDAEGDGIPIKERPRLTETTSSLKLPLGQRLTRYAR